MYRQVPLRFHDPDSHEGIDIEHLVLGYNIGPTGSSQDRFRDRLLAKPTLDLGEYRFGAVYDWIEVFIDTGKHRAAGQHHNRLKKLAEAYGGFSGLTVYDKRRRLGVSGQQIVVRLFDPEPSGLRLALLSFLRDHCAPSTKLSSVVVTGLELSLDVYPNLGGPIPAINYATRRMLMNELLVKHCIVNEAFAGKSRMPRFHFMRDGRGTTPKLVGKPRGKLATKLALEARDRQMSVEELSARIPKLHSQPFSDATWYFGAQDERLMYRCMNKLIDKQDGRTHTTLPIEQTRARIEVALMDETPLDRVGPHQAGIGMISDLADRPLQKFNQFFQFAFPTFAPSKDDPSLPDAEEWAIFAKTGVAGLQMKQDADDLYWERRKALRARKRGDVLSSHKAMKFSKLNDKVAKAIRRLDERWERDWE